MFQTMFCSSNSRSFVEVIQQLEQSPTVEGIAQFGSGYRNDDPASDYDLLIVVSDPPINIFQMQTYIDGIVSDLIFVETELVERTLMLDAPTSAISEEGYLIGWLVNARILFDRNVRLTRLQQELSTRDWRVSNPTESERYAEWFWLNFDLRHMKRLAASADPIRLMTLDMRLMSCVSMICRSYFRLHGWHWSGEKDALRMLQEHDPVFFDTLERFLAETHRSQRLTLCEQLLVRALNHPNPLWLDGATAVWLRDNAQQPERAEDGLQFWEDLLTGTIHPPTLTTE
ncbi:MAG: hypothetical protein R3E39_21080 [Anaerolineae bacterium]